MEAQNKEALIRQIPLFGDLTGDEFVLIDKLSSILDYKKDQIIYRESDPADNFYCVILGRVVTYTIDSEGRQRVLEYLHHGRYFGIISLLTNEPHSVTAKALNDSSLLVIKKADFELILNKIPRLAIDLSHTLSRRVKDKNLHQKTIFESTIISVFSSYSQAGKTIYALNLALSLHKEAHKSVVIIDLCPEGSLPSLPEKFNLPDYKIFDLATLRSSVINEYIQPTEFGINVLSLQYKPKDEDSLNQLLGIFSLLINDYHYLILDLPAAMDGFVFGALNQSDFIHILSSPRAEDLKMTRSLVQRLRTEVEFQEEKIKIIVNEYTASKISFEEEKEVLGSDIYATLPHITSQERERIILDAPQIEYAKAVRRISRQLGDSLVGLALGVGVGYGFCHIGVLKVIEEENIPVDIIVGSSIGSLIASLWATGIPARRILEISCEEFKQPKYTWGLVDLTFPLSGFMKGNKLYNFLKKYLGGKTFYDVKLPLKIIASDIRKKESYVLDKGLLIDAVMASCSMPGVFMPFNLKEGTFLVDGGIASPLPTEVLFKIGVKKIIAVNVTPSREDIIRELNMIKEEIAASKKAIKERKWFDIKKYLKERLKTNILDIIFSSIELMQSQIIQKEGLLADVVLHPDTHGLHWLELYRAKEFALRGEAEARKQLDRIKYIVNE